MTKSEKAKYLQDAMDKARNLVLEFEKEFSSISHTEEDCLACALLNFMICLQSVLTAWKYGHGFALTFHLRHFIQNYLKEDIEKLKEQGLISPSSSIFDGKEHYRN